MSLAALSFAICSASSDQPTLPRLSFRCASVRTPMIGAVKPGCCSSQFNATWLGDLPHRCGG